jgi:hAT family C-terminal dimerisation region
VSPLANFAKRILNSIGNSVPSERAFSTMNFIYSKNRNRLSIEYINKLIYIYINVQVLTKLPLYPELIDDDILELESLELGRNITSGGLLD